MDISRNNIESVNSQPDLRPRTDYIKNPLPVPERKAHVEMDYDHKIPQSKMCFDIENPVDNYFDIE